MDLTSALDTSYSQTAGLVAQLADGDLAAASPCAGWDVRALLNHLLGTTWMFTMVNRGQAAGEDAGDVIGADPLLAVTTAATENVASWGRPGGFDGERSYPFGTFPAQGAAMINLGEVVVHNWDLADRPGRTSPSIRGWWRWSTGSAGRSLSTSSGPMVRSGPRSSRPNRHHRPTA